MKLRNVFFKQKKSGDRIARNLPTGHEKTREMPVQQSEDDHPSRIAPATAALQPFALRHCPNAFALNYLYRIVSHKQRRIIYLPQRGFSRSPKICGFWV